MRDESIGIYSKFSSMTNRRMGRFLNGFSMEMISNMTKRRMGRL
jgi:hypothetical protein